MIKPLLIALAVALATGSGSALADPDDDDGERKGRYEHDDDGDDDERGPRKRQGKATERRRAADRGTSLPGHGFSRPRIPAGHYPPRGECRIWYPQRAARNQ